jgi:hypothetical protein
MSIADHLPWSEIVGVHVALAFSCEFFTDERLNKAHFPAGQLVL